jgi:hypothetical protein
MYSHIQIHFCSEPSANILSTLAKNLSNIKKHSVVSRVKKIEYSCIGYHPIDHSMCILPSEVEITNFLTVMMYEPIFIYNRGHEGSKNLVERVKNRLTNVSESLLNEKVARNSMSTNYAMFYIFNRETDEFPMLAHGITYASLL